MSRSSKNRLRLASEILLHGFPCPVPCDRCLLSGSLCVAMEGRAKCAECIRLGRPCVNLSWASLDKTREQLQKEIDADEHLLSEVMARLLRKKKILQQANDRAKQKALHLMEEMEVAGELEVAEEDCPAASVGVAVSPMVWSSIGFLDDAVATLGEPAASSGNSSGV